jgi:excisionase family DNA binding protein
MVNTKKDERLFSVQEAAQKLGVSHDTVARWCRDGLFPHVVKENPFSKRVRFRIPEKDVVAVMERMNEPLFS